jgi:hypothetical protein
MPMHDSLSRSSTYIKVISKFWETEAKRKDSTISNTLVMFEDTLNDDVCNEGWFLLASSFLLQSFEFMIDGTRNPATKSQ